MPSLKICCPGTTAALMFIEVPPYGPTTLEDLARYIIRACLSHERMVYIPEKDTLDGQAKVIYRSKNGRTSKTFEASDAHR